MRIPMKCTTSYFSHGEGYAVLSTETASLTLVVTNPPGFEVGRIYDVLISERHGDYADTAAYIAATES